MATFEQFIEFLQLLRADLKAACAARPENDRARKWLSRLEQLDGQEGEWLIQGTREAWEALRTPQNHLEA